MKYPSTRINLAHKISAYIAGYTRQDATDKIIRLIQNNYRRRMKNT